MTTKGNLMPTQKKFKYKGINEGRWDQRRMRWISAEEDFADMAKKATWPDGSKVGIKKLYECFKKDAAKDVPGISQFCKYILTGIAPK